MTTPDFTAEDLGVIALETEMMVEFAAVAVGQLQAGRSIDNIARAMICAGARLIVEQRGDAKAAEILTGLGEHLAAKVRGAGPPAATVAGLVLGRPMPRRPV